MCVCVCVCVCACVRVCVCVLLSRSSEFIVQALTVLCALVFSWCSLAQSTESDDQTLVVSVQDSCLSLLGDIVLVDSHSAAWLLGQTQLVDNLLSRFGEFEEECGFQICDGQAGVYFVMGFSH